MRLAIRSVLLSFCGAASFAQTSVQAPAPDLGLRSFAPPAPPILVREATAEPLLRAASAVPIFYSIGDPTPEEQLYVEYINRARALPQAEALIMANTTDPAVLQQMTSWGVKREALISQFAAFAPVQPLAINAALTRAARRHTADMLAAVFQGHTGSDGSNPGTRVQDEAYNLATLGENVYANAGSVFSGHAGFEVDWGPGADGMQTPPGHRNTIHNGAFREIGVGVINGRNEAAGKNPVGPQLVTQEFGTQQGSTPFITGVAYYDLNGNNFYDAGEGIGSVFVDVNGVAAKALTALSGGYAIPVPGNGSYTVTFSFNGFAPSVQTVTIANQLNSKLDFKPAYTAPLVTGPDAPATGRASLYSISSVPGATAYQWRAREIIAARAESAENGAGGVTIDQSEGYAVIQGEVKSGGLFAFHLAHPASDPRPQSVTLKPTYLLSANSSLSFASRLGWAAPGQTAKVQISLNDGQTWQTIYSQAGTQTAGETSFNTRSANLSAHAGSRARFRFLYDLESGFVGATSIYGWHFDDIQFSSAQEVASEQSGAAAADRTFSFTPPRLGNFVLQGRAKTGHDFLAFGPEKSVQAVEGSSVPEFRISRAAISGSDLQLTVDLLGGTLSGALTVESKASLSDNWSPATATVQTLSATQFLVKPNVAGPSRFYRLRAN